MEIENFKNNIILPLEPVMDSHEGHNLNIKSLADLITECEADTGISDLATQHDHYLYGNAKK